MELVQSFPVPNAASSSVTDPALLTNPQTLTASYATLGSQVSIGHCGQIAIDIQYAPAASSRNLFLKVEVSPNDIDTSEANSKWFPLGQENDSAGTLNQEPQVYKYPDTSGTPVTGGQTYLLVPYEFSTIHKKMRIRVQEDGSSSFGTAQAWVNYFPTAA